MRSLMLAAALGCAATVAHAQTGSSFASPTTGAVGTTSTTPAPSGGFALGHASGTGQNVPPPPPASVTTPANELGVPPTPAPARPGLPTPPTTGSTPTTVGLDVQALAVTRPGQPVGPETVASVQTVLAQNGFYRGPIDGTLNGSTRASIRAFQASAGLPASGDLDAQTASLLAALALGSATTPPPATGGSAPPTANAAAAGTVDNTGMTPTTNGTAPAPSGTAPATGTPVPTVGVTTPGVASGTGVQSYRTSTTPPLRQNVTITAPSGATLDTRPFPLGVQVQSTPAQDLPLFVQP